MPGERPAHPPEAAAAEPAPRVILLPAPLRPPLRALALALAERGHSLILWPGPAAAGEPPEAAVSEATLDLQLEIARAGGISLAPGPGGLAGAAEALGRIDAAVALGPEEGAALAGAVAALERGRRPGRVLVLAEPGAPESPAAGETLKGAGLKILTVALPAAGAGAEDYARLARKIAEKS